MALDYARLSKTISHALRHAPDEYGLTLAADGSAPVTELIAALGQKSFLWRGLTEQHLHEMIGRADKQRYEIRDGRIRALYGHSIADRIEKQPEAPPEFLYHGTSPTTAQLILQEGLRAMGRQYAHLSLDAGTARSVGERKSPQPVVLQVRAGDAHRHGVAFYRGNESIWLADYVPAEFLLPDGANPPHFS